MDLRTTTVVAIGLSLAACACDRTTVKRTPVRSTTRTVSADSLHFDRSAGAQVASLRWNRPGSWIPVRLRTADRRIDAGLVARDRYGARLLNVSPMGGYDVRQIDLSCGTGMLTVGEARSAATDSARIQTGARATSRPMPVMVPPEEVARICGQTAAIMKGTPIEAAAGLRGMALGVDARRTAPDASERAEAWKRYQAETRQGR